MTKTEQQILEAIIEELGLEQQFQGREQDKQNIRSYSWKEDKFAVYLAIQEGTLILKFESSTAGFTDTFSLADPGLERFLNRLR